MKISEADVVSTPLPNLLPQGGGNKSYAAATRRKPFHIAVAAPEVSTGR